MALEMKKAKRSLAKLKLCLTGASGSGKTMSSLLIGYGLIKAQHPEWNDEQIWDKICIIDTENGSGSLYVGSSVGPTLIGEYNTINLEPPFSPLRYVDAISVAEQSRMEVIIVDSLTHAWSGQGGALDKQGAIAERTKNSFTAWRTVTPEHNKLVDALMQCNAHLIADIRAKTEYSQEKGDNGKTVVRNVGLAPIFREGIEYEFTVCFMLDANHVANATKDRTAMFDGQYFVPNAETGRVLADWLSAGHPEPAPVIPPVMQKVVAQPVPPMADRMVERVIEHPMANQPMENQIPEDPLEPASNIPVVTMDMVDAAVKGALQNGMDRTVVAATVKQYAGTANYKTVADPSVLAAIYNAFNQ